MTNTLFTLVIGNGALLLFNLIFPIIAVTLILFFEKQKKFEFVYLFLLIAGLSMIFFQETYPMRIDYVDYYTFYVKIYYEAAGVYYSYIFLPQVLIFAIWVIKFLIDKIPQKNLMIPKKTNFYIVFLFYVIIIVIFIWSKMISILITCYNQELVILDTIKSLQNAKTSEPFNIIVSDDYSSDNSFQVLKEYAKSFDNISIIRPSNNLKVGNNRNCLLEACTTDYACFVDGDDAQDSQFVENLIQSSKSKKDLYSYRGYYIVSENTNTYYEKDLYSYVWLYLMSKKVYKNLVFDTTLSFGEDFLLTMQYEELLTKNVEQIENTYNYHKTKEETLSNNLSNKKRLDLEMEVLDLCKDVTSSNKKIQTMYNEKMLYIVLLSAFLKVDSKNITVNIKYLRFRQKLKYIIFKILKIFNQEQMLLKKIYKKQD